jgi:hypothetical protein
MPEEKNHFALGALLALGLLLAVYVFVPYVLSAPAEIATRRHWISVATLETVHAVVAPVGYLRMRLPLYDRLMEAERKFCMRQGWVYLYH